jgi:hypothetical protein
MFLAVGFGACVGAVPPHLTVIGVSTAEAKTYYTKKRVNGVWIAGRFAKRSAAKATPAAEPARKRAVRQATVRQSSISKTPVRAKAARAAAAENAVTAPHAPADAPSVVTLQAKQVQPAPALAIPAALPVAAAVPAVVPVAAPIQEPVPVAAPPAAAAQDDPMAKLREALQARANTLTVTTGSIVPPPRPEAQSVSLDFDTGMKTTVFKDGTTVREPFDVSALRGLASPPPAPIGR